MGWMLVCCSVIVWEAGSRLTDDVGWVDMKAMGIGLVELMAREAGELDRMETD